MPSAQVSFHAPSTASRRDLAATIAGGVLTFSCSSPHNTRGTKFRSHIKQQRRFAEGLIHVLQPCPQVLPPTGEESCSDHPCAPPNARGGRLRRRAAGGDRAPGPGGPGYPGGHVHSGGA